MKTVLFTYPSPVGEFGIRPEPAGRVQLGIGRNKAEDVLVAEGRGGHVANRTTGWEPWIASRAR